MQVRDLDEDVQQTLRAAATREGLTLSAFLRRELSVLAARLEVRSRAQQLNTRDRLGITETFLADVPVDTLVAMIREDRDR